MNIFTSLGFNPAKNSFRTLFKDLKEFESIDGLPKILKLRCEKFKDTEDLYFKFLNEKAVFHKSCVSMYNEQKLGRKRKLYEISNETEEEENVDESHENPEKRAMRRSLEIKTFTMSWFFFVENQIPQ